jgi:hypothetical protein
VRSPRSSVALGLLERQADRYANTPAAAAFLAGDTLACGAHKLNWLCGLRVFVDQSAGDRSPLHVGGGRVGHLGAWRGWSLTESPMWSVAVVVRRVPVEDGCQVSFADDQDPVEAG